MLVEPLNDGGTSIDSDKGDYLLLVDYGSDGLRIESQHKALSEAINRYHNNKYGPTTVVKLVRVCMEEYEE